MDEQTLAGFRKRLLARRAELQGLARSGDQAAGVVELDQSSVGRLSRMDALQGQAMSLEAKRRREAELRRIEAALTRMDNGEYGECLECGEPIALARLELDPSTPLCVACAGAAEKASPR
jgi:DnaK suppressor protein